MPESITAVSRRVQSWTYSDPIKQNKQQNEFKIYLKVNERTLKVKMFS